VIFLGPADLRALDAGALGEILARTDCVVAFGAGEIDGTAAAALLFADYAVIARDARLTIDTDEGWAAAAWRLQRKTIAWAANGAKAADVVDELTDADAEEWRAEWMRGRSVMALDSAAALIRSRGGDALERAEFARLFAAGEPQKGLGAFLAKSRPTYSGEPS
jgi:hypothetical protein